MTSDLRANVVLQRGDALRVGAERIALLAAIAEHGSIGAAARARRMSYRAAWDAVQALNTLFDTPLVASRMGGASGGETVVTPHGRTVMAAFTALQAELAAAADRLQQRLSADAASLDPLWSLGLRLSARNILRADVVSLGGGGVNARVMLDIGEGLQIASFITRRSAEALGLRPGRPVLALIKADFVTLDAAGAGRSGINRLRGVVTERIDDELRSEVQLELSSTRSLVATAPRRRADELGVRRGLELTAAIDPSHVLLAAEGPASFS